MRVKDVLESIDEWDLNPLDTVWYLKENRVVKGIIIEWKYNGTELIGLVSPLSEGKFVTLGLFLCTLKEYDVSDDTEILIDVPEYGRLQSLTNWSLDKKQYKFSSEVYWDEKI